MNDDNLFPPGWPIIVSTETIELRPGQRTFRSAHDGRIHAVPDFERERLLRLLKGEAP